MIVVDEYLAIRSLVGDLPQDLPDDFLGMPASAHWRLLQRLHAPSDANSANCSHCCQRATGRRCERRIRTSLRSSILAPTWTKRHASPPDSAEPAGLSQKPLRLPCTTVASSGTAASATSARALESSQPNSVFMCASPADGDKPPTDGVVESTTPCGANAAALELLAGGSWLVLWRRPNSNARRMNDPQRPSDRVHAQSDQQQRHRVGQLGRHRAS